MYLVMYYLFFVVKTVSLGTLHQVLNQPFSLSNLLLSLHNHLAGLAICVTYCPTPFASSQCQFQSPFCGQVLLTSRSCMLGKLDNHTLLNSFNHSILTSFWHHILIFFQLHTLSSFDLLP